MYHANVEVQTMTDGSKVYDVHLIGLGQSTATLGTTTIVIAARDRAAANAMARRIAEAINSNAMDESACAYRTVAANV